jgi:hypothetical protein
VHHDYCEDSRRFSIVAWNLSRLQAIVNTPEVLGNSAVKIGLCDDVSTKEFVLWSVVYILTVGCRFAKVS